MPRSFARVGSRPVLAARMSDAGSRGARVRGGAVLAAMTTLTLLIGFSRIYLGVHWPSDVVAGWAVGSAWALAWWWLLRKMKSS